MLQFSTRGFQRQLSDIRDGISSLKEELRTITGDIATGSAKQARRAGRDLSETYESSAHFLKDRMCGLKDTARTTLNEVEKTVVAHPVISIGAAVGAALLCIALFSGERSDEEEI
jgi:ElaB/YqjD/DUF883 family membrane-anchored ribosome-binding protein